VEKKGEFAKNRVLVPLVVLEKSWIFSLVQGAKMSIMTFWCTEKSQFMLQTSIKPILIWLFPKSLSQ